VKRSARVESEAAVPAASADPQPAECQLVSPLVGYERWASTYDTFPNPLLAREERYLLPLLGNLHETYTLDLACGTGRWLEKILARGERGVGLDFSAAMLQIANGKDEIKGRLARAVCERIPFRSGSFDLAICSFALGHIDVLDTLEGELARVTKVGADIFVSDLHPEAHAWGWRSGFRDKAASVQVLTRAHAIADIVQTFCNRHFECVSSETLWLGEPEKPIFEAAGKLRSFTETCTVPALFVCHFKRIAVSTALFKHPSVPNPEVGS